MDRFEDGRALVGPFEPTGFKLWTFLFWECTALTILCVLCDRTSIGELVLRASDAPPPYMCVCVCVCGSLIIL